MSKYSYKELQLLKPNIEDHIMDLIIELDHLRKKKLGGTTPAQIFFQLKSLFHMFESIGSARIEGNHTSILDFIDSKIEKKRPKTEEIKEIQNVQDALGFIDIEAGKKSFKIDEDFIKELHKRVVADLSSDQEGDANPGEYRKKPIVIQGANHIPPPPIDVDYYMDEFIEFINKQDPGKYDLLKIALSHHRFVWIHPFGNGNGRTVRLLTYAQLVHTGFNVAVGGRVINPTAIFCSDRNQYYDFLSKADSGSNEGLMAWCEYVLQGLTQEIEKIDRLTDYSYLSSEILLPAIDYSLERKFVNKTEADILKVAVRKKGFQASDLKGIFPDKLPAHISRYISRMKTKKMISSEYKKSRKYLINFEGNYMIRSVIEMLDKKGFLPIKNEA